MRALGQVVAFRAEAGPEDGPGRMDLRRSSGERFELPLDVAELGPRTEGPLAPGTAPGRRRLLALRGRRGMDAHRRAERANDDSHVRELEDLREREAPCEDDEEAQLEEGGEDEDDAGAEGEWGRDEAGQALGAEMLALQLRQLNEALTDVTVWLPGLGRVRAQRSRDGSIALRLEIPERLFDQVRRGEGDLRARLSGAGLPLGELQICRLPLPGDRLRGQGYCHGTAVVEPGGGGLLDVVV